MREEGHRIIHPGCLRISVLVLLSPFLLLIFLLVVSSWWMEAGIHLLLGPFIHAKENLPPFLAKWQDALLPLLCLAVALWLGHRLTIWGLKASESKLQWRAGYTLAVAALVLLGSAAAISLSGVTHQAVWLGSSPLLERSRAGLLTVAASNAKLLILGLDQYRDEHGHYPDTLEEAMQPSQKETIWIQPHHGAPPEPFVFLAPRAMKDQGKFPVIISPVLHSDKVVLVGYSDGGVKSMTFDEWQTIGLKTILHE